MVLTTHARVSWAEGGFVALDVFFALSGFLITGLLLKQLRSRGRISLRDFYGRRAKRLLPAAGTVLIVVSVFSLILFGPVTRMTTGGDVVAAALYFVNWHFVAAGIDYFAFQDGLVSPVQHYWSLSVEEQFYILWPAVLVSLAWLAARFRRRPIGLMLAGAVLLSLASLAYSIVYSPINPDAAYFSTLTRTWQILFGAVLALVLPRSLNMPRLLSELLVIAGIASLLVSWIVFNEVDPYPGWRALVPVLGTISLIVGGTAVYRGFAVRFLALRPFQYLGKISYSWYLWHWPLVIFAMQIWGAEIGSTALLAVIVVSWLPAQVCHSLIEEPFRRSKRLNRRPFRALALGAVFSLAAVGCGLAVAVDRINLNEAPEHLAKGATADDSHQVQQRATRVRPSPENARDDRGVASADGCLVQGSVLESPACRYSWTERPEAKVVIFGDSHGLQYSPTLLRLAKENNWEVTVLTRGNCLIAKVPFRKRCDHWRQDALRRIEAIRPDLTLVATGTLDRYRLKTDGNLLSRLDSQPLLVEGLAATFRQIKQASTNTILIRDQARAPFLPFECVAENPDKLGECTFEASRRRQEWAFDFEAAKLARVRIIDPGPVLCPNGTCPSVIGNALVYRDTYHLTATFARTLAPWLKSRLPNLGGG